ncbi:hypothetical protein BT96DRAFT_803810 [Gymnopus androsaceus JB14]|uniref:ER-bound oxygenase mpaB/mpaB'/Rubber oxygenase catalytic domain-containing protein n=1 Tax=Gymnopus androsaceus JB14 TaxID=1447944 RepID=A0A6A4IFR4_9AGAR|nr:hypothetical protein BT96DRAFT_803810 [Gymnopus androsaceus JB14]
MVKVVVIQRASDTLSLKDGDTFQVFGHSATWNHQCVRRETALRQYIRWRNEGDSVLDDALQELFPDGLIPGADLFQRLESCISSKGEKLDTSATTRFWEVIHKCPPDNIRATEKQIELAQSFFIDHSAQIMQALLYYSLAGGFASPRIVRTLNKVSYLVPHRNTKQTPSQTSKDRIFRRLLETFQFVLEVMRCVVPIPEQQGSAYLLPGGDGWKAIVRVRMLHGVARARATQYDNPNDIPINQEDMNGTLASFSTVPLWALRQLGLSPSPEEAEAYLALWCHVGFYLGVSPASLSEHFTNVTAADQFLASATIHLFLDDEELEDKSFVPPTMSMLEAVAYQPPLHSSVEFNCAITRFLLGAELATHLGVPRTSWWMTIRLRAILLLQAYPVGFSKFYGQILRPGWLEKRRYVYAVGMAMMLRRRLGMRQTKYRPEGETEQAVWEDESVSPDYTTGHLLVKRWRQTLAEMVGVSIASVILIGLCCWKILSYIA